MSKIADGLLVLGMHRSGTSAFAGTLERLGVTLSEPLMAPKDGENSRGYFELLDTFEFHERFLARCSVAWDDPRYLDLERVPKRLIDEAIYELAEILLEHFSDATTWAVKDPRLCRLLPIWQGALERLGAAARYVVVLRHPDEVAASLAVREGFSRDKADLLWADHVLEAERHTRGGRRAFLSYRQLLENPAESCATLAERLQMAWPRGGSEADAAVAHFLDGGLRHHRAEKVAARGRLGPLVPRLYEALLELEKTGRDSDQTFDTLARDLDEMRRDLEPLVFEHMTRLALRAEGRADKNEAWLQGQSQDVEELRDLLHELEDQLSERTRWLQIQDRILHDQVKRLDRLEGKG